MWEAAMQLCGCRRVYPRWDKSLEAETEREEGRQRIIGDDVVRLVADIEIVRHTDAEKSTFHHLIAIGQCGIESPSEGRRRPMCVGFDGFGRGVESTNVDTPFAVSFIKEGLKISDGQPHTDFEEVSFVSHEVVHLRRDHPSVGASEVIEEIVGGGSFHASQSHFVTPVLRFAHARIEGNTHRARSTAVFNHHAIARTLRPTADERQCEEERKKKMFHVESLERVTNGEVRTQMVIVLVAEIKDFVETIERRKTCTENQPFVHLKAVAGREMIHLIETAEGKL